MSLIHTLLVVFSGNTALCMSFWLGAHCKSQPAIRYWVNLWYQSSTRWTYKFLKSSMSITTIEAVFLQMWCILDFEKEKFWPMFCPQTWAVSIVHFCCSTISQTYWECSAVFFPQAKVVSSVHLSIFIKHDRHLLSLSSLLFCGNVNVAKRGQKGLKFLKHKHAWRFGSPWSYQPSSV